ncbi:MAG: vWA domain-containing protein [Acidimicrobiia bacterium]
MTGSTLRRLCIPILLSLGASMLALSPAGAAVAASVNQDLESSCGLDLALVLDRSGSVTADTVQAAANAFLDQLADTGSTVSLVSFSGSADADMGPTSVSGDGLEALKSAVSGLDFGGATNWEDGLLTARGQFPDFDNDQPHVVVMITDGDPTTYNGDNPWTGSSTSQADIDRAVTQANFIRDLGVHMLAVGVDTPSGSSQDRLKLISGPNRYPDVGIGEADWTDVDVEDLSDLLTTIATDLCKGSVVVNRLLDGNPAAGFQFTASGGVGDPDTTEADGVANFKYSWGSSAPISTTITQVNGGNYPIGELFCVRENGDIVLGSGNAVTVTLDPQELVVCTFGGDDPFSGAGTPSPESPNPGVGTGGGPGDIPIPASCETISRRSGYWMVSDNGSVYAFGQAQYMGGASEHLGSAKAVDLEPTPSGNGYWIVDNSGRVFAFGDASWLGNADISKLVAGETVTSLSRTMTGNGYWIFTTRGRVFTFGDAVHHGDLLDVGLNGRVLDSIPTASGLGYYMVGTDGGVFTFGDAVFLGSMGSTPLNGPVQSLVPNQCGPGYWLVATDGGIFSFDVPFRGSKGGQPLNRPVSGMVPFGNGYLMVAEDGGIFTFSNLPFFGSLGDNPPPHPIVSVAVLDVP